MENTKITEIPTADLTTPFDGVVTQDPPVSLNGTAFIAGTEPKIDHITDDYTTKAQIKTTSHQLLQALYKIWDAFERANVPFFLVGQTAKDAIKQHDLTGDKVEVGIRRMEWVSGGRRIIDNFITPEKEDSDTVTYVFDTVPVILHIYDDHDCIVNTDMVRYRYEEFKVPNPYETFEKVFNN